MIKHRGLDNTLGKKIDLRTLAERTHLLHLKVIYHQIMYDLQHCPVVMSYAVEVFYQAIGKVVWGLAVDF